MDEPKPGFRWSYGLHHSGPGVPVPGKPGWVTAGPADYYFVCERGTLRDDRGEHFQTKEAAEERVTELNDADALASIRVPRTHRKRFDRFRELQGKKLGWIWYDGKNHPLTRLPRTPERYAVETCWDEGSSWATYESLDAVREELLRGDVERVVDLDSGEDVPFVLRASIGDEVAAMREP